VILVAAVFGSDASAQDTVDPANVLKRFVGTWKTKVTHKPAEWTPEEGTVEGRITIKLVLDGRFIEETGRTLDEDVEHRVLWGYDTRRQAFRSWFFDSRGISLDWTGKWNEKERKMVWEENAPDGMKSLAEHHIIDADHYEWKSVTKDAAGKVYLDLRGKHTRIKNENEAKKK
jgi:hypothetical protein